MVGAAGYANTAFKAVLGLCHRLSDKITRPFYGHTFEDALYTQNLADVDPLGAGLAVIAAVAPCGAEFLL